MNNDSLSLTIRNREDVLYEGLVKSITSFNDKGKFDVLPQHANFITLINKTINYKTTDGTDNQIEVNNGILRVISNKVMVYLGIGE